MSEEILINVTPRETRVALVENGMLQEVYVERASRRGYVGNIYKGRVQRVMPGMQAAFVEVGLERAAFLHASDIVRTPSPDIEVPEGAAPTPPINELLHEGQEVIFVLEGTMSFRHGEEELIAEEGDCVYFDSSIPHSGVSLGDKAVKCFMVIFNPGNQ